MTTQSALAGYFRAQAEWRLAKAEEYPDDSRNWRSAEDLNRLAEYVELLPDDDPRIVAAGTFGPEDVLEFVGLGEGGYPASRIGFTNERDRRDPDLEFTWYVRTNIAAAVREFEGGTASWERDELERVREIQLVLLAALAARV